MLLYGFVWFGQNSEAEVKTINEWKGLWSDVALCFCLEGSKFRTMSQSVSKVGIELLGQLKKYPLLRFFLEK